MLSYAGVTLPVLTTEVAASIEARLSTEGIYPWDTHIASIGVGGYGLDAARWRDAPIRLGRLCWPTGASRWAKGFYVVTADQLASIREVVYGSQYVEGVGDVPTYQPADLEIGDGTRSITASMYMLTPRPLLGATLPNEEGEIGGLWLLPLVDQRYFWWKPRTGNFTIGGSDTWSTVYGRLAGLLGISFSSDTVSTNYFTPPTNLQTVETFIPPLLDYLAKSVGQRIVVQLDGTVTAQGWKTALNQQESNLDPNADDDTIPPLPSRLRGGYLNMEGDEEADLPPDVTPFLPTTINVDFVQGSSGNQPNIFTVGVKVKSLQGFGDYLTNGKTKSLFHPFQSGYTTEFTTLANQYSLDWCNWLLSSMEIQFAGVAEWVPEGLEDWIEWTYVKGLISTRIERLAWESADIPQLPTPPTAFIQVLPAPSPLTYPPPFTIYLGRSFNDAILVGGSNLISSASANFTSADIGTLVIDNSNTGLIPTGTIVIGLDSSSPPKAIMSQTATRSGTSTGDQVGLSTGTVIGYQASIQTWINNRGANTSGLPAQLNIAGSANAWWYDVNSQLVPIPMPPGGWILLSSVLVYDMFGIPIFGGGSYYGATGTDALGNIFVAGTCINVGGAVLPGSGGTSTLSGTGSVPANIDCGTWV